METAFFLYRSVTQLDRRSAELKSILDSSRERNGRLHLTGHLHMEDGFFYQWLEGPEPALSQIGTRIEHDPRHHSVEYLWRGVQQERQFGAWSMGFGASQPGALFDWIANHGVLVGGHRSNLAQGLLGFMRAGTAG